MQNYQYLYQQVLIAVRRLSTDTGSLQLRLMQAYLSAFFGVPTESFPKEAQEGVNELHAAFGMGTLRPTSPQVLNIIARAISDADAEELIICIVNVLVKLTKHVSKGEQSE